ncbi:XdhC family protein, partial [Glutamicibacter creatinolyticus]|uniref:XdhC family protein n=1 Tax=Glutamicibacter creatinolyticus TaxID=162496 RepID=UPI003B9826EB
MVVGANAFGQALVEAAKPLGFRITLCDPRSAFADPAAFPDAEVVQAWPHRFLA